jgi:putative endonuclease
MTQRRSIGERGETRAAVFLEHRGFVLHARNWHCRAGELDLVMQHGATYVFVEVRVRAAGTTAAATSIGSRKQARLVAAAQTYLAQHDAADADWRIDVVTIAGDHITHLPYAIEG